MTARKPTLDDTPDVLTPTPQVNGEAGQSFGPAHGSVTNARNVRPTKCCRPGEYACQVPMPLNGRRQDIDFCIADLVTALNAANIRTVASCCGHGDTDGTIILEDGRTLRIENGVRWWERNSPNSEVSQPAKET